MSKKTKIAISSLFRDSEDSISYFIDYLSDLKNSFDNIEFYYFFYENDSEDNTRSILKNFRESTKNCIFTFENLGRKKFGSVPSSERTILMSNYRNKNRRDILESGVDFDKVLILDSDLDFSLQDFEVLNEFHSNNPNSIITSNCRTNVPDLTFFRKEDCYYDVYCFRDKFGMDGMYFSDCPFYLKDDSEKFSEGTPIKICSGFGGMAIIDYSLFEKSFWSSSYTSEHVEFCYRALQEGGSIYLHPLSTPFSHTDLSTINLDSCKNIASQQFEKFKILNSNFKNSL